MRLSFTLKEIESAIESHANVMSSHELQDTIRYVGKCLVDVLPRMFPDESAFAFAVGVKVRVTSGLWNGRTGTIVARDAGLTPYWRIVFDDGKEGVSPQSELALYDAAPRERTLMTADEASAYTRAITADEEPGPAQDGEERLRAVYRTVMDLPTYKTPVGTTFVAREDVLKLLSALETR